MHYFTNRRFITTAAYLILAIAVLLLSISPLKARYTDPATFSEQIESIDERKATVVTLSAAAAAAATGIAAIPGDASTPIANQVMEVSSYLMVVVCVLVLEKMLISVVGGISFGWLLPAACVLFGIWALLRKDWLYQLAIKIAVFALIIAFLIPCSVMASDMIYEANSGQIEEAIVASEGISAEDDQQKQSFWDKITSSVQDGAEKVKTGAQHILNKFIDAIALFLITYCAIPVLVVLALLWLMKMFFGVNIPAPKALPKPRLGSIPSQDQLDD